MATILVVNTRVSRREELRQMDDNEVVKAHLGGDEQAFNEIVRRYRGRLLNFIFRSIGDGSRAFDLVQEVFLRVHKHLNRFDSTKKFSTWIYTIAGNLAKNELRNRSRKPLVLFSTITQNREEGDEWLLFEDTKSHPEALFQRRHLRDLVESAIRQLPPHHRRVFILRELEGMTYEEIAKIDGSPTGTVKSRLNRARNAFARIISPMLD